MRPFDELTIGGQGRRLRGMALRSLEHYDLQVVDLRLLTNHFNSIFRVDTEPGKRYILRINRPSLRSSHQIRSELAWLDALRQDTSLVVPRAVEARDGSLVQTVEAPGVPEPRHCVIFEWIEGRDTFRNPTIRSASQLGALMATLHNHADTFVPPAGFAPDALDDLWRDGMPEIIYSDEPDAILTPERRALLREGAARVCAAMDALYADRSGLRFLHADVHLGNVKVHEGELRLLDFDDSLWCFPVQDIGIALYYLRGYPNEVELRAAFMDGYTKERPLPEEHAGQIDTFIVARQLDLINFVIQSHEPQIRDHLPAMVERAEMRLHSWLA